MKISRTRIFKAKVDVAIPDGETDRVESFIGHFLALPSDELKEWPGNTTDEQDNNLRRVFVGWDGLVDDTTGEADPEKLQPFVFTSENRDDMIREPRYRTGYEIKVSDEPAAILEELFKASATQIAEVGGLWKPRTGGPGLPVWFMTDDDVIITSPQELDPFPGSDQRFNGVSATCPDPATFPQTQPSAIG